MSNADVVLPAVEITLDKKRKFCLNLRAIVEIEKKVNKSLFKEVNWMDLGFKDMTLLLWGGLIVDDPSLTIEEILDGKLGSPADVMKLMPMIMQHIGVAFPKSLEAEEKKEPKPQEILLSSQK